MSTPSATVSATASSTPVPHPDLKTLNSEHTRYLQQEWLPQFILYCEELDQRATGDRLVRGVKGEKKEWTSAKVYPKFMEKFYPVGSERPNAESVKQKLNRWLLNAHKEHKRRKGVTADLSEAVQNTNLIAKSPSPETCSAKAPRPTTATALFAKDQAEQVRSKMKEIREQEGHMVQEGNFKNYRTVSSRMFEDLLEEDKAMYESCATAYNEAVRNKPPIGHVYENQATINVRTMEALHGLIGEDWGQHGRAAFFTIGAFRNENDKLKLFNVSVGPGSITSFSDGMDNYKASLRLPFRKWAEEVLPTRSVTSTVASIERKSGNETATSAGLEHEATPTNPINGDVTLEQPVTSEEDPTREDVGEPKPYDSQSALNPNSPKEPVTAGGPELVEPPLNIPPNPTATGAVVLPGMTTPPIQNLAQADHSDLGVVTTLATKGKTGRKNKRNANPDASAELTLRRSGRKRPAPKSSTPGAQLGSEPPSKRVKGSWVEYDGEGNIVRQGFYGKK